jgi:hypothetical protein
MPVSRQLNGYLKLYRSRAQSAGGRGSTKAERAAISGAPSKGRGTIWIHLWMPLVVALAAWPAWLCLPKTPAPQGSPPDRAGSVIQSACFSLMSTGLYT